MLDAAEDVGQLLNHGLMPIGNPDVWNVSSGDVIAKDAMPKK